MLGRAASGAAFLLVVLSLAACGGAGNAEQSFVNRATSSPSAPVEQAFLDRANAICQPVLAYNASHPNPDPSFDYNNPDVAGLKIEGPYFTASPYADAVTKLIALGSPTRNAASWQTLMKSATTLRDQVTAQAAAAVAGNVAEFTATLGPINKLSYTVAVDAHQAGFAADAPCQVMLAGG